MSCSGMQCTDGSNLTGKELVDRVRARRLREVNALLESAGISASKPVELLMIAYKKDQVLEVWARQAGTGKMKMLKKYPICRSSGLPGPKRKEGDRQVPEGFYTVTHLNPNSSYHLSVGINYPNASDRILSDRDQPGSDIFIHGKCVTIGCIPLGDEAIEELYLLCGIAMQRDGFPVQVYIFPMDFMSDPSSLFAAYPRYVPFWENLKSGHDLFKKENRPLKVSVNSAGIYSFR